MSTKQWYRKKRWLFPLALLFLWIVFSRTEMTKLRYQPEKLSQAIEAQGQVPPKFATHKIGEAAIQYVQVGDNPALPTIVLIHGSPGALNAYELYLSDTTLSRHANLLAIDRPGFGYSDFGQAEPSLAIQAQRIAEVLKTMPATPKIWLGHSMGGPVIVKMAMDYPDLVDGLVMVAPSICPELEPSNTWRKILNWIPIRWLTPPALRVCNQEIIPLKAELEKMLPDWEKLAIPVTVIQGIDDVLVPVGNADFAEEMLVKSAAVKIKKIEGGDHFILWSEVPLITQALLELVKNL